MCEKTDSKTMHETNKFHLATCVNSDNAQRMSKRGKNICQSSTSPVAHSVLLCLYHFDINCVLSKDKSTAKWNIFVQDLIDSKQAMFDH